MEERDNVVTRATADSWETQPMPKEQIEVALNIKLSEERMQQVEMGIIPQEMEDRWFMYCSDGHMRWFRSWTGYCIFDAEYIRDGGGYLITTLHINADRSQYTPDTTQDSINTFRSLLSWLI